MQKIQFVAERILGDKTYSLEFRDHATVIVGPNGTGKSTFLSLYYLFISQQWDRLSGYEFGSLELRHNDDTIKLSNADLINFGMADRLPARLRRQIDTLSTRGQLSLLFEDKNIPASRLTQLAGTLDMTRQELENFRSYIKHSGSLFNKPVLEIQEKMNRMNLGRILYMPTYRRIEKDLQSIFPDIDERFRLRLASGETIGRKGKNFQEIVSFGMEDIASLIDQYANDINKEVKNRSVYATQQFIRDMVRGEIGKYSVTHIRQIDDSIIQKFITRLDDTLFTDSDKQSLLGDLGRLRTPGNKKPKFDLRYLGYFVEQMLEVFQEIEEKENYIRTFVNVISRYIHKSKSVVYDSNGFRIVDSSSGASIKLSDLSSGEKQVIAIFAYLYLSSGDDFTVLIDEPELSLSVPWQKNFLPDVLSTGRCRQLVAVTHSPFVVDNHLRNNLVDVNQLES